MKKNEKCAILTASAAVSKVANAAVNKVAGGAAHKNVEYLYAARVRQLFAQNDEIRDRGLTAPDDIVRVTDLVYGEDPMGGADPLKGTDPMGGAASARVLDIYYPVGTNTPLPVIVSVHGGGYVYGDKNLYRYYCMSLARRGFSVVNFSYRLAPENKFPAQIEDTNAVMQFVCEHAQEYFLDLKNVFMVGDSAGAQLATQYCTAVSNPAYAEILSLRIPSFALRACAFNCGLYIHNPRKDRMMMRCYFDGPAERHAEQMDVAGNLTKDFPPTFLMTSTGDFLRERAEPFAAMLTALSVENEVHVYGDEENRPGHVFHCDMRNPLAHICNDEECAFFRKHMAAVK